MNPLARENLRRVTPPIIWDWLSSWMTNSYRHLDYQGVRTMHMPWPLHHGKYAELYERFYSLDPTVPKELTRYRIYNHCMLAHLCRNIPGDFVSAGVSFGVSPRIVYDFVEMESIGKTLHLIDPFDATTHDGIKPSYNTDPELVRRQFPPNASIRIHRQVIPHAISNLGPIAFAFMNTGNRSAECASLPLLYERLSPGGFISIDQYCQANGYHETYNPVFEKLGVTPFWFPSGQCAITKP